LNYIYIIKNTAIRHQLSWRYRFFYTYIKIGYSKEPYKRFSSIKTSVGRKNARHLYLVGIYRLCWALTLEQLIHRLCKSYRQKFKGSGKTEYFLLPTIYYYMIKICLFLLQFFIGRYIFTILWLILFKIFFL